jgi:site-specific recombinase XerD
MDIKQDPIFREFILNRNLKSETVRSYTRKLQIYCQISGLSPTQLIEQAEEDEDNGVRSRKRRIKGQLLNYQEYLIQNDFSPWKIVDNISTIRGFYNHYEIQIPNRIYSNNNADLTSSEIPSKEDIQLALSNSSQRYAL